MASLVKGIGSLDLEARRRGRPDDAYGALVRSIVGQQLSTKAARIIYGRLINIFDGRSPAPGELALADDAALRAAGLSRSKIGYLRDLSGRVSSGELDLGRLNELSDEEASARLVAVKGLGPWSADMFLMFHLRRPDVLPVGDLGIRRAIKTAYGLPELPGPAEMRAVAERWCPHRTLACLYLWELLDAEPIT